MKEYDKNPVTISFFNSRSQEEINALLKNSKYVTFITTFMNFDWFEKMLIATPNNAQIIGKCIDDKRWNETEQIAKNYNKTLKRIK